MEAGVLPRRGSPLGLAPARIRTAATAEHLALLTTAVAIAMLPLLVPSGPGHSAPADVLICVALVACVLWATTAARPLHFPYIVPMFLFIAGGALGALAGPVPGTGLLALIQDLLLLGWCWVVVAVASSRGRLKILLSTWAYSSICWALVLLAGLLTGTTSLTGQSARNAGRTALTFIDPNVSANYYVVSMMVIWATGRPRSRGVRLAAYALLLAALFTTGSNSGAVSLIVSVSVAAVIAAYRQAGMAPAVALLACILLVGYGIGSTVSFSSIQAKAHNSQYTFIREGIGRGDKSVGQREEILHESIRLFKTGGVLGQGPVSTKPRLEQEMAPFEKEAHDDYFAALVERGFLGAVGLLLLIGSLAIRASVIARGDFAEKFQSVVIRPHALVGALAGTMVAMTVYELLHVRHVWTLFAFVAALIVWGRD